MRDDVAVRRDWASRLPVAVRNRPTLVASIILFVAAFALYAFTMAPGLTWKNEGGDGGDFLAAAHTWGIPHPTGYPSYIILLRSFSEIVRIGDEAFRANLFSALAAALTVPFFFLAARKLLLRLPLSETRGRTLPFVAAFVAALAFGTSKLHWSQATITEVYTLNAMFVALFIWLALIARTRTERGERAVGVRTGMALLLGVAFGNHITISFIAVPFGIWIYWPLVQQGVGRLLREWQPIVALLVGLSVYAYAPIASAQDPALNWFFPNNFPGFRSMASASLYQPYVFGLPRDVLGDRVVALFELWLTQFTAFGAIMGLAGVMFLWSKLRGFAITGAVSLLSLVIYSVAYNSFDSYVFLIPAIMVFGLWIAAGLLNLVVSLTVLAERASTDWFRRNSVKVTPVVIAAALIGMPIWSIAFTYGDVDISDDTEARDYVENAFSVAGQGAVIVADDIPTFSLWYQSLVVDPDQDVAVIAAFLLHFDWYWEHIQRQFPDRVPQDDLTGRIQRLRSIMLNNIGQTPVFLTQFEDEWYSNLLSATEVEPLWEVTG